MLRRRSDRVRCAPRWELVPGFPEVPAPPRPRDARMWGWAALAAALCLSAWWVARLPSRPVEDISRPKVASDALEVEVSPAPQAPDARPEEIQEAAPATASLPSESPVASAPSAGLVEAGSAGGAGNGLPGLDLGVEGNGGSGLAVAAGGGGRGGGAGTGVGSGVGSQRMVYQMGQVDQDASAGRIDPPAYPRRAKEDLVEAHLELRLLVDERGRVEKIEVLGAPPGYGFESAVENASRSWRFQPAQLGGVPVPQWVRMPLDFHLN